jgi:hypothetical protein
MRINWKLPLGFALFGAAVSLIAGLAGGNPFGIVLLRLFFSALAFALLGLVVGLLLRRYFPELSRAPSRPAEEDSGRVDIIIDEELPGEPAGEPTLRAPGSILEPAESGEGDLLPEEPVELSGSEGQRREAAAPEGDYLEPVPLEGWEGTPPGSATGKGGPGGPAAAPAAKGDRAEDEELEEAGFLGGGPAPESPAELFGEGQPGGDALPDIDSLSPETPGQEPRARKTAPTRREMRQAQIEETVRDHDPAELARAVRTIWKKDQ